MYCSKCGKPISDDSTFCMYCGAKLEDNIVNSEDVNTNELTTSDNTIPDQDLNTHDMNYYIAVFVARLSTLWSGRINRTNYFLGTLLLHIAFLPCFFIENESLIIAIGIIIYLAWVMLSARRLHDIDKTGGWAFFLSVPLLGFFLFLYLIFKRGTSGENEYGPDPLIKEEKTLTDWNKSDEKRNSVENASKCGTPAVYEPTNKQYTKKYVNNTEYLEGGSGCFKWTGYGCFFLILVWLILLVAMFLK